MSPSWRSRFLAGGIHLAISLTVAMVIAALILGVWYPFPYYSISGGLKLFGMVAGIDAIVGPLLTLVVFDRAKPRAELLRDMAVITALQIGALAYGMHTVFEARPIGLVFEVDRFRAITANEVLTQELPLAPPGLRHLPLRGPRIVATRQPNPEEKPRAFELALAGYDLGQRPSFWVPYEASRAQALQRSRPIDDLIEHHPQDASAIRAELHRLGIPTGQLRFLPLQARSGDWVVVLDQRGTPIGFLAQDGFF